MKKAVGIVPFVALAALAFPLVGSSQETYRFERMWPALQQSWNFLMPNGAAFDKYGNFYVADSLAHRIVKLNQDGLYMTDWGRYGELDGQFKAPLGVAVDEEGNVYVTDQENDRVQKFDSNGNFIPTNWNQSDLDVPAGIAVDRLGNVYVADVGHNRIQKYNLNGEHPTTFAESLDEPYDVAVDSSNNVYVAEKGAGRIRKYNRDGFFEYVGVTSSCNGGFFDAPIDLDIDEVGNIYIACMADDSIWKLDAEENCVRWEGEFNALNSIAIDKNGYVYTTDEFSTQKFTPDGNFITRWSKFGDVNGEFNMPSGVAIDSLGHVYVADINNHRIQQFTFDGKYEQQWITYITDDEWPDVIRGIATDQTNNDVFALDYNNRCFKRFVRNQDGTYQFDKKWGGYWDGMSEEESGDGKFNTPTAIAVDMDRNVFVADAGQNNARIQKFKRTLDGEYIFDTKWEGDCINPPFSNPLGIAIDSGGNVYITDGSYYRILKFTPDSLAPDGSGYSYDTEWGGKGVEPGKFITPWGIAVDNDDNVYVTDIDTDNPRVQKFSSDGACLSFWGGKGLWAGQFARPEGIAVSANGRFVYVADKYQHRIQVFQKYDVPKRPKAIIVAGGGPHPSNNLWDGTQVCTNFAYKALIYQGYAKDDIYYLSPNAKLDLDWDGIGDVNADANLKNLEGAITQWAIGENEDTDSLLLYLNDHGGSETFTMSIRENGYNETYNETLGADQLSSWLRQFQDTTSGKVTVVYEACQSGSFIDNLLGNDRIIITSTLPNEQAKFLGMGTISFSYFFWTHIFNGLTVGDAYLKASEMVNFSFSNQNPMMSGDASYAYLGNGAKGMISDAPSIENVSAKLTETGEDVAIATLTAKGVKDPDGIARVWAVIWPPDFDPGTAENPLLGLDLPTCELLCDVENTEEAACPSNTYTGTYSKITADRPYQIAIYAMDKENNVTLPQPAEVSRNYHVIRKAIIIAGVEEDQEDQEYSGLTGDVIDTNASRAFSALCAQDYSDSDDIYFMSSSQTAIEGVERVNPSYETLEAHLDQLTHHISTNESLDLVIYLIGAGDSDAFKMSNTETLTTSQLSGLLDSLTRPPESLPVGTRVTIIYDGDKSGSFIAPLASSAGSERIIITSASEDGPAYFNSAGDICFSFFFWSQIANGATVYKAFAYARQAITYLSLNKEISFSCYPLHLPLIDADRDGTANEADDYAIARARSIGLGTKFAADTPPVKPTIGSASVEEVGGEITISAENITPAGQIQRVWAIVKPIAYCPGHSGEKTQELEEVDLEFRDGGNWIYNGPSPFAGHTYKVSVYAMDTDRNTSDPKEAKAYHPGGDIYEDPDGNGIYDDDPSQANVIVVNHPTPQPHTFHTFNGVCDRDWVKFYGVEGQNYTIEADNLVNPYPIDIKIYRGSELSFIVHNQMLPDEGSASYPFSCPGDGIYYVMLSSSEACSSDETMSYDLKVYDNNLGLPVHVTGTVRNSVTGDGIDGAVIKSLRGVGRGISVNGEYQFYEYPGNYTITATKNGYAMTQRNIAIESEDVYVRQDITMHPQSTEECTADADCDDDLFCNGTETCADGTCQPGPDSCADDGLFCNGQETCNEENDSCGHAGDPCPANLKCDEEVDACVGCLQDADCPDDGLFCTGTQTCVDRTCQPGTNPCPDGVECDEETDQCLFPALAVTPQIIMQSHWMPLPVFMSIRGTNIHFTGQKDIIFNPPSVIGLPLLINQQTLLYMGLMMPTWITRQPGDSIEVTVTAGAKQATGSVNVMLLPFMLKEESR